MKNSVLQNIDAISYLRKEIIETFGLPISNYGDCKKLEEEIFNKTGEHINISTIRRFFDLIPRKFGFSNTTLNLLSRYCGYKSFADVESSMQRLPGSLPGNQYLIDYICDIFQDIPSKTDDETINLIIQKALHYLNRFPELKKDFYRKILKTSSGRSLFFEQYIFIDELGASYGDAVMHYMQINKNKKTQLFGNSLLFIRSYLKNEHKDLDKYYNLISNIQIDHSFPVTTIALYYSVCLLYNNMKGKDSADLLLASYNIFNFNSKICNNDKLYLALILSFSLLVTGHYEESYYYADSGEDLLNRMEKTGKSEFLNLNVGFTLVKGIYYALNLQHKNAISNFNKLKISEFSLLSKKLFTAYYCILKKLIYPEDKNETELLEKITNSTGFKNLIDVRKKLLSNIISLNQDESLSLLD